MNKIGVMTPTWNEEATIVFSIDSLINHVERYVVVDTGSTDKTVPLIKHFFSRELRDGKLVLLHCDIGPNRDMSIARNMSLDILRRSRIDYGLTIDADMVYTDCGARSFVNACLQANVHEVRHHFLELYQGMAHNTNRWLLDISSDMRLGTYNFTTIRQYGINRARRILGAVAKGCWTDEIQGKGIEGIYWNEHTTETTIPDTSSDDQQRWAYHYGWARPVDHKFERLTVLKGAGHEHEDSRLMTLLDNPGPWIIGGKLQQHPESFYMRIDEVMEFFDV